MNELTREQVALLEETIEGSMKEEPGYGTGWIIHEEEGAAMKAALETIAALRQRVERVERKLDEWQRIVIGSGTDQETVIRMAASEYTETAVSCWKEHTEKLTAALAERDRTIARLREALKELRAIVKGECPSLLDEDSGGDANLDIKIDEALTAPSVPYPDWCRHKDQCAGKSSCPEDPTCAD